MSHISLALMSLVTVVTTTTSWADRGALSVDAGGAATTSLLPTPYPDGFAVTRSTSTWTSGAGFHLGVRYAITHDLEVSLQAFYEPGVPVFHNNVTLESQEPPVSPYPGTLSHRYTRYGAAAGVRRLWGYAWRVFVGADLGWAHSSFTNLAQLDDRNPSFPTDYRLELPSIAINSLLLSAGGGVEWAFADKMSITVSPRLQLLLGRELAVAATLPVLFSFSWYF